MRQLSIDQLDNEGRRVSIYDKGTPEGKTPMFQRTVSMPGVHKRVINELLRPRQWKPNHEDRHFMLSVGALDRRAALLAGAVWGPGQPGRQLPSRQPVAVVLWPLLSPHSASLLCLFFPAEVALGCTRVDWVMN